MPKVNLTPVAESIPFDNDSNGFSSDDVQGAIDELSTVVGASASPGFNFGRSGNVGSGTWLNVTGNVPSNRAGITVALNSPEITQVFVANQNINTFDIGIYEHEGDQVNLTLLGTVSVVSSRSETFTVSIPVTSGRQLAVRVTSGSTKNVNVGLQLKGNV